MLKGTYSISTIFQVWELFNKYQKPPDQKDKRKLSTIQLNYEIWSAHTTPTIIEVSLNKKNKLQRCIFHFMQENPCLDNLILHQISFANRGLVYRI